MSDQLQPGEQYLSLVIGKEILAELLASVMKGEDLNVALFLNKEKTGNQPDYKGKHLSMWKRVKKAQPQQSGGL